MLDVPVELLRYLSRLLAAERRRRSTPAKSRKLTCREQAKLALRWFRDRTRIDALGRDHGISRATAYRYVAEAVDVLSAQAPGLPEALERAMADGVPYVILDGKVFAGDRCSEPMTSVKGEQVDAWYSGKAHRHGGNVQAVMRPDGLPLWTGPAEPGSVHDITAARLHALPALYLAAALGMPTLADSGYEYYICCFSLCERAAAQRGTWFTGSGYMSSPPFGRRGSPGEGGETGAVVGPACAGLVAAAPV
jgi:DDE superfamily endonuclease